MATVNSTSAPPFIFVDAPTLRSTLSYKTLISHLQTTLPAASTALQSPTRHSHQTSAANSLLLMPCWSLSPSLPYIGVKLVTHHPNNSSLHLPSVHATFTLFHSLTGQPLAAMDGGELTLLRTSCVSALASLYLSNASSQVLLMVGAGSLAPHLIKAHLTTRPAITRVLIWNRNTDKAKTLADKMGVEFKDSDIMFQHAERLEEAVGAADIVSCATCSEAPLVAGARLKGGAHLDLVGSFKPSMRECDDEAIRRGRVFVDGEAAMEEAGELVGAVERGVIRRSEVAGSLVELVKGDKAGRRDVGEITVFKSVGSAAVDVLATQLVYESLIKGQTGQ